MVLSHKIWVYSILNMFNFHFDRKELFEFTHQLITQSNYDIYKHKGPQNNQLHEEFLIFHLILMTVHRIFHIIHSTCFYFTLTTADMLWYFS